MSSTFPIEEFAKEVVRLSGRPAQDPELRKFLDAIQQWPLEPFPPDEFHVFAEDKALGYSLKFEDAAVGEAKAYPARTPLLVGGFFYSQGKDGFQQFAGTLPFGVTWGDSPEQLVAKLGAPKFTINNKKTGAVQAYRWAVEGCMLSTNFKNDGSIGHVFVGVG